MQIKKLLVEIMSGLLVLMFLYASTVKLLDFQKFISDMDNQPFPDWATSYLVAGVLLSEAAIVLLVMFEKTRLLALYISTAVMVVFTLYIVLIQADVFEYAPCPCGGIIEGFTWWQHFFFNLFFLAISVIAMLIVKNLQKIPVAEPEMV